MLEIVTVATIQQNWHITPNISECAGPISTNFSALVQIWVKMINLTFVFAVAQGTLLW